MGTLRRGSSQITLGTTCLLVNEYLTVWGKNI